MNPQTQTQQHNQQFTVNMLAKSQKPSQIWQHNQDTAPCSLRSTTCQAPSLRLPTCGLQPAVSNPRSPTRDLQPAISNLRKKPNSTETQKTQNWFSFHGKGKRSRRRP
ncbi:hypothetical protein ACOMHN_027463 [Nucella lapillus]